MWKYWMKLDFKIEPGSIGLNLSPLMARFVRLAEGSLDKWTSVSAEIINSIIREIPCRVYLIPHVMGTPGNNDYVFLKKVLSQARCDNNRVRLVHGTYNAPELKWIISKMSVFAGARMHATIAAFSSYVPTLSFAYSMKAKGMNEDVFGHEDYCISPEDLCPAITVEKVKQVLKNSEQIHKSLKNRIPKIQALARDSGKILKEIIS